MPEEFGPALQRLHNAVEIDLAQGPGPICERLKDAWQRLAGLDSGGVTIPDAISQEVRAMKAAWARFPGPTGRINQCVDSMTLDECLAAAAQIVHWLHRTREARSANTSR
jgi:hypothetical protein